MAPLAFCAKPGKRDEHRLEAAAAAGRRQLLDADEAHLGTRPGDGRVNELRFRRHAYGGGLGGHSQHDGEGHRHAGADHHWREMRFETGDLRAQLVAIGRQVGPLERAVGAGDRAAGEGGQGADELDVNARHDAAELVGDDAANRGGALGRDGERHRQCGGQAENLGQAMHFE